MATDVPTCADCFSGSVHTATPSGHIEIVYGLRSYITRGSATSNSTIVFLTDGFGINLVNNKLLADQYASKTGFRVLMPIVLPRGGLPLVVVDLSKASSTEVAWYDVQGYAKRAWVSLRLSAIRMPFDFRVRRLFPVVLGYIRAVKAHLPLGAKLGVAGFCLGGNWSLRVCSKAATAGGDSPLVDAHFTAHPTDVSADDIAVAAARFGVPLSVALGAQDVLIPIVEARKVETKLRRVYRDRVDKQQVCIYERCGHGFALRVDAQAVDENEGAERALEQAVIWFRRFLA